MEKIILNYKNKKIHAMLNDTLAAKAFKRYLPFYITLHKYKTEYKGTAPSTRFEPTEMQTECEVGSMCLQRGWLTILLAKKEEGTPAMIIIGKVDVKEIEELFAENNSIRFRIERLE